MSQMESLKWYPSGSHTIMEQLHSLISVLALAIVSLAIDEDSFTQLGSYDNTHVVVKHTYVIADTGLTEDFNVFTPYQIIMVITILNSFINYQCPYKFTEVSLVIRKSLHITSTKKT